MTKKLRIAQNCRDKDADYLLDPSAAIERAWSLTIPNFVLVNTLNAREHRFETGRRTTQEKKLVGYYLLTKPRQQSPATITMTRIYSGRAKPMDGDGLSAAFKATRDAIAAWIGVDDAESHGLTWIPKQERGASNGVRIEIAR